MVPRRRLLPAWILTLLVVIPCTASAQTVWTCFPGCSSRDGRMLRLAPKSANEPGNDTLRLKITSRATAASVAIGVFDGDAGGHFDGRTVPLRFALYADPDGDGAGLGTEVAYWSGTTLRDNDWSDLSIHNSPAARAPNGAYIYTLIVAVDQGGTADGWNGIKVRTDGGIALKCRQELSTIVPLASTLDADVVYPDGVDQVGTSTFDGTWQFYLHLPDRVNSLTVWDYNHGGGRATDDHGNGRVVGSGDDADTLDAFSRPGPLCYQVKCPYGCSITNRHASLIRRWTALRLETPHHHCCASDTLEPRVVDSLPAGIYQVLVHGMDLQRPNTWRFFGDEELRVGAEVVGVDESGKPRVPIGPYDVCGVLYYDDNGNGVQDPEEAGIPSVRMLMSVDADQDGTIDRTDTCYTSADGSYLFAGNRTGWRQVRVDTVTLAAETILLGPGRAGQAVVAAGAGGTERMEFAFARRQASDAFRTRRRAHWAQETSRWPVTSVWVGHECLSRTDALRVMQQPTWGDMSYAMAAEVIAAKLNVAEGEAPMGVPDMIARADAWMLEHPIGSSVSVRGDAWRNAGDVIFEQLHGFNSGRPCPAGVQ